MEKTFDNCKYPTTGAKPKFDFYIENKYLIEYDGEQHFKDNSFGIQGSLKIQQERDKYKNHWCKENNIPLIRIPYTHKSIILEDILLETSKFIVKE